MVKPCSAARTSAPPALRSTLEQAPVAHVSCISLLRPRPHLYVYVHKRIFFYAFRPPVHTYTITTNAVNASFRKRYPKWIFSRKRIFSLTLTWQNRFVQHGGWSCFRVDFPLLGLISSLVACLQMNITLVNVRGRFAVAFICKH